MFGYNFYGQLGLGDTASRGDNPNEMGDNLPYLNLGSGRAALSLVAGYYHTCVLLDNKQVKCFGHNDFGQLGLGDKANRGDNPNEMGANLPYLNLGSGRSALSLVAGGYHTCALLDNKQVKCFGGNFEDQLGLGDTVGRGDNPNEMGDNLPYVNLGTQAP